MITDTVELISIIFVILLFVALVLCFYFIFHFFFFTLYCLTEHFIWFHFLSFFSISVTLLFKNCFYHWVPLESSTLRLVSTEPLRIHYYSSDFLPGTGPHSSFLPWASVTLCLSNLGSSGLPCVLLSLHDPRRIVDFSVGSVFPLFLGWSHKFQAPYMQNHTQPFNGFCSSSPPHSSVYTLCRQSVGSESQRTASQVCFSLAVLFWA